LKTGYYGVHSHQQRRTRPFARRAQSWLDVYSDLRASKAAGDAVKAQLRLLPAAPAPLTPLATIFDNQDMLAAKSVWVCLSAPKTDRMSGPLHGVGWLRLDAKYDDVLTA